MIVGVVSFDSVIKDAYKSTTKKELMVVCDYIQFFKHHYTLAQLEYAKECFQEINDNLQE